MTPLTNTSATAPLWEDLVIHPEPVSESLPEKANKKKDAPDAAGPLMAMYWTHELRAPLTSIHSALCLLQEKLGDNLTADTDHILRLAMKNSNRLASLIDDIMDLSSANAGKVPLQIQPVAPKALIQEATDALMSWAVSKGIKLLRIPEEEPLLRVWADPKRTVQALINLISNAIKFTPAGGRVEVYAKMGQGEHKGTIVFSVRDTGPGVRDEDRQRIFRCFEQGATGAKNSPGTGIGLALSKALVEVQGGRIWVESWKGLGATFRFTVPVAADEQSEPISPYPEPIQWHGLLLPLFRRLNSIVAFFSV